MNLLSPLYFQIPELRNLEGKYQEVLQEQDNFLEALGNSEKFPGLILSLRYLFDPEAEPREKLKIYLGINHAEGNDKIVKEAGNFLTKGSLGDYYRFKLLPTPPQLFQKLTWVEEICEVIKYEEFDQKQDFYVPYLFAPNPKNDMFSVCKRLNRVDAKMAIEVTLQTCDGWAKKKISDILAAVLREINPSDHRLQTNPVGNAVRDNYDDYNRGYLQNKRNLFKYNIKILAESGDDISLVISDLARKALGNGKYGIRYREIQLKKGDANFEESLRASERVELSIAAKWEGWETEIAEKRIENLSSASSGISFPIMLEKDGPINEENNLLSSKGEMVKSSDSAISKFLDDLPKKNRAIAKIADLQPLARMVTPTEISGFFRIVLAGEKGVPGMALEKPRHKIVKDEKFSLELLNLTPERIDNLFVSESSYRVVQGEFNDYDLDAAKASLERLDTDGMLLTIGEIGNVKPEPITVQREFSLELFPEKLERKIKEQNQAKSVGFIPILVDGSEPSDVPAFLFFCRDIEQSRPELTGLLKIVQQGQLIYIRKTINICPLKSPLLNDMLKIYQTTFRYKSQPIKERVADEFLTKKLKLDFQGTTEKSEMQKAYLEELKEYALSLVSKNDLETNVFLRTVDYLIIQALDSILGFEQSEPEQLW